ncbi:hypothetical protein DY000_02014433 [Brassica cretica]|uniref:OCRE domain-containing protein n=1 Tax=Brassica cretica TaxID=69181 RepID=A0ABQ7D2B9_BRACR|nr:hypothetical protein DY000_02014433 [Brassica cretica]
MQKRDDTDQFQAEDAWERTRTIQSIDTRHPQSIDKLPQQSIDINNTTSIDNHPIPKTTLSEKDKFDYQYLTPDEFDVPKVARQPEFGKRAYDLYGNRKFYWEEKDEYGIYRNDHEFARDLDGHTIPVHTKDIRRLQERASRDEPAYICLPEHASSFTQTKNKEAFQMKLDSVYYPLNDSISWLTTCMEEMKKDIARIQNTTDTARPPSIDRREPQSINSRQSPSLARRHHASIDNHFATSIDTNPPHPHTMKAQPYFHTREEIDQLVEAIYRALETTEERLDRRCDDIYFPMDLTISALTSKVEAIQGELVEIQSYISRRPEASISNDRRNNNRSTPTIQHRSTVIQTEAG